MARVYHGDIVNDFDYGDTEEEDEYYELPCDSCDDKSSDSKSSDSKSSDGKSSDGKSSDGKSSDGKSSDGKSSDGKSSDGKSSDGKSSGGKLSGNGKALCNQRSVRLSSDISGDGIIHLYDVVPDLGFGGNYYQYKQPVSQQAPRNIPLPPIPTGNILPGRVLCNPEMGNNSCISSERQ
ncbi:MAG: hypothetical protein ACTJLM_05510 [Ehrlichia sp.]